MAEADVQQPESRRKLLKVGLWWVAFNAVIINILSYKYLELAPSGVSFFHNLYLFLFSVSYMCFVALLPLIFVYVPALMLSRRRKQMCRIYGAAAYTLYLLIIIVDSYVFSLYRFHLNHTVAEQIFAPGATQVFELSIQIYILAAVVVSALFMLEILFFNLSYKIEEKTNDRILTVLIGTIASLLLITQVTHAVAAARNDHSITCYDKYLPMSKPLNINSMLSCMGMQVNLNKEIEFTGKKYNYPLKPITETEKKPMNVVVILLDSWTHNTLDSTICPNIFNFAKQAAVFTNHYSGGNCTRNGLFSLMYGLPAVYWYDFKDQHIPPLLMTELKKHDYDISLYPSASLRNPAFDQNAFCLTPNQCDATSGEKAWERDRNLALNFINYVKAKQDNRPFFSLLFFDSLHSMLLPSNYKAPFQPTWQYPEYAMLGKNTDPKPFVNLYKNMASYLDGYVGQIINELEAKGMMKNTVIIITGDHGQEFNENGKNYWGHNGNFSEYQLHVPFIYYMPGRKPAIYNHWSAHYDVAPTLLHDVLGVTNEASDYSIGHSLFDTTPRTYLQVDGYNGLALIRPNGLITNVYYDGTYDIVDRHLNEQYDMKFDEQLYQEAMGKIESFYKK
ncbi:MAG: DUF3413 domain-containing protein [Paludibacteraceae bacterium]|jgi:membrane-anchored protein YejM (alkaline phosphatase superfamily)|nr:DUF3413 domain-containing protein [Paludibacteraceae bacterium]